MRELFNNNNKNNINK